MEKKGRGSKVSSKETEYIKEFFDRVSLIEPEFNTKEDTLAYILAQEFAKLKVRIDELEAKGVAKSMKPYNIAELASEDIGKSPDYIVNLHHKYCNGKVCRDEEIVSLCPKWEGNVKKNAERKKSEREK